jgi:hypothetical protein
MPVSYLAGRQSRWTTDTKLGLIRAILDRQLPNTFVGARDLLPHSSRRRKPRQ